jgi:hypothetical protein
MTAQGSIEEVLWIAGTLLTVGLLARLAFLKLLTQYPALSSFLALQAIRSLYLLQFQSNTNEYVIPFVFTEPVLILSRALVVFELYEKILASYRGLSLLSRNTMAGLLGLSVVGSLGAHLSEFTMRGEAFNVLRALHLFETTVYTALFFFLLVLAVFLVWYPAPVKKNVVLHCLAFSTYFLITAAAVYLRNQNASQWTRLASTGRIFVFVLTLAVWILLLKRSGETTTAGIALSFSPAAQEKLLAQLDALNRSLESGRNSSRSK